jgi:hypothetical protein
MSVTITSAIALVLLRGRGRTSLGLGLRGRVVGVHDPGRGRGLRWARSTDADGEGDVRGLPGHKNCTGPLDFPTLIDGFVRRVLAGPTGGWAAIPAGMGSFARFSTRPASPPRGDRARDDSPHTLPSRARSPGIFRLPNCQGCCGEVPPTLLCMRIVESQIRGSRFAMMVPGRARSPRAERRSGLPTQRAEERLVAFDQPVGVPTR